LESEEGILRSKELYNGRDWLWVTYQGSLIPFYQKFNFKINDMTMIIDKDGKVAYGDSYSVPPSRIEDQLKKLGVGA